jgi:hypothetical protein
MLCTRRRRTVLALSLLLSRRAISVDGRAIRSLAIYRLVRKRLEVIFSRGKLQPELERDLTQHLHLSSRLDEITLDVKPESASDFVNEAGAESVRRHRLEAVRPVGIDRLYRLIRLGHRAWVQPRSQEAVEQVGGTGGCQ